MKKLILALILSAPCSPVFAFTKMVHDFDFYRDTVPAAAATFFNVTSSATWLDSVTVSSGSGISTFQFFNGSSTALITSTGPVYDTTTSGTRYIIKVPLTNGFIFTTTGNSRLDVKWDYFEVIPKGLEGNGRF